MRIARFSHHGEVGYGPVLPAEPAALAEEAHEANGHGSPDVLADPEHDRLMIAELAGHPFGGKEKDIRLTGARFAVRDVRLLAPILPSKVIGIGRNYADHAREMGSEPPAEPIVFLKPSTSVCGPGDPILRPAQLSERIDYEGELAVVIGRLCREVPAERVADVTSAIPARTTSRRATCRGGTDSGPGPRDSTRSARSGRGSRPTSIPLTWR